jgi:hypothetical protein
VHLVENELLRSVFDVSENANAKISLISTVKRTGNKSRTVGRRNSISRKDKAQNAFLYEE